MEETCLAEEDNRRQREALVANGCAPSSAPDVDGREPVDVRREHEPDGQFTCVVCQSVFSTHRLLQRHRERANHFGIAKRRNYREEEVAYRSLRTPNDNLSHPLQNVISRETNAKVKSIVPRKKISSAYSDPLSQALEGSDPLNQFVSKDEIEGPDIPATNVNQKSAAAQEWLNHRTTILSKFTTSEKLSIKSSFLQGGEKLVVKQEINNKIKHRLQQLDEFEEHVSEHRGLSRDDYVSRITQISQELHQAWALDQRVKALKIVIQCSKLLLETHPFAFYPSKFALITDILDKFGRMVFERIAEKGEIRLVDHQLPKYFKPEHVSESARETCRNWMYKIASVRELLPRIYVEMAVLESYSFLENTDFSATLIRLSRAIRGVGNPLVAAYARAYLMRVGREIRLQDRSFVVENVRDLYLSYNQLYSNSVRSELTIFRTDLADYLSLFSPAYDWIFQTLAHTGQYDELDSIWRQSFNQAEPGLLWLSLLSQFPSDFVLSKCLELALHITTTPSTGVPSQQLMVLMGQVLSRNLASSCDSNPGKMLNVVWPYFSRKEDADSYLQCMDAWMPYLLRHWRVKEMHRIINDIVQHCRPKAQAHHVTNLTSIIHALVRTEQVDYQSLFTTDSLMGLLDIYPEGHSRAEAAKILLQQFLIDHDRALNHPLMVDHLLSIARILHDTLNATSVEDEKRQISEIAVALIDRVDFGRDFQQMLSFYADARAAFTNLDPVLAHLVQAINRLSSRTRQLIQEHNERTGHFVRACGAFAYITIPAITCPMVRFRLYLLSSQVALANECLGQADACLEGAISLVTEFSPAEEQWIGSNLSNLLSTLLVQPDTPDQNRLHHLRRLLRNVRTFSINHALHRLRSTIYVQAIRLLSAYTQPDYIYHVPDVESNDRLYLGDEDFRLEAADYCSQLLTELLNDLNQLGNENQYGKQASLCLDLFSLLIEAADLKGEPSLTQLAAKLFLLARKHNQWDADYASDDNAGGSNADEEAGLDLVAAFRVFDRDKNGFITKDELRLAMELIDESMTEEGLNELIKMADVDKDGRINYEEFAKMLL
uniref:EOG090X02HV n=1 Tax=Daphnia lumholtzi TaxID=42856 RepID=A0A4Y7M589_9CRUS|nr:EOG090X02HV [Daphnia lumholtzi]SVE78113.1 EOG090X02HV [Daphnia lumholtzi]